MSIKRKIKNVLGIGKKPKVEIYRLPAPFDLSEANKRLAEENAQLKAELLKLRKKMEDRKEEGKRREMEERELRYVESERMRKQMLEKKRTLILPIFGIKKYPTFFLRDNTPYKKFKGFVVKQSDNGATLWYPLLTDGKKDSIPLGPTSYATDPMDIFKTRIGVATQILGGKVDSNYEIVIDENGEERLHLHRPDYAYDENGNVVRIVRIDDQERKQYEDTIEQLKIKIMELQSEIENLKEREIEYETSLAEKEVRAKTAEKERDIFARGVASFANNALKLTSTIVTALGAIQHARTNQVLTEELNTTLMNVIDDLRSIVEKYIPREQAILAQQKIEDIVSTIEERLPKKEIDETKIKATKPSKTTEG